MSTFQDGSLRLSEEIVGWCVILCADGDKEAAKRLHNALARSSIDALWGYDTRSATWHRNMTAHIHKADVVLLLWSGASANIVDGSVNALNQSTEYQSGLQQEIDCAISAKKDLYRVIIDGDVVAPKSQIGIQDRFFDISNWLDCGESSGLQELIDFLLDARDSLPNIEVDNTQFGDDIADWYSANKNHEVDRVISVVKANRLCFVAADAMHEVLFLNSLQDFEGDNFRKVDPDQDIVLNILAIAKTIPDLSDKAYNSVLAAIAFVMTQTVRNRSDITQNGFKLDFLDTDTFAQAYFHSHILKPSSNGQSAMRRRVSPLHSSASQPYDPLLFLYLFICDLALVDGIDDLIVCFTFSNISELLNHAQAPRALPHGGSGEVESVTFSRVAGLLLDHLEQLNKNSELFDTGRSSLLIASPLGEWGKRVAHSSTTAVAILPGLAEGEVFSLCNLVLHEEISRSTATTIHTKTSGAYTFVYFLLELVFIARAYVRDSADSLILRLIEWLEIVFAESGPASATGDLWGNPALENLLALRAQRFLAATRRSLGNNERRVLNIVNQRRRFITLQDVPYGFQHALFTGLIVRSLNDEAINEYSERRVHLERIGNLAAKFCAALDPGDGGIFQ